MSKGFNDYGSYGGGGPPMEVRFFICRLILFYFQCLALTLDLRIDLSSCS